MAQAQQTKRFTIHNRSQATAEVRVMATETVQTRDAQQRRREHDISGGYKQTTGLHAPGMPPMTTGHEVNARYRQEKYDSHNREYEHAKIVEAGFCTLAPGKSLTWDLQTERAFISVIISKRIFYENYSTTTTVLDLVEAGSGEECEYHLRPPLDPWDRLGSMSVDASLRPSKNRFLFIKVANWTGETLKLVGSHFYSGRYGTEHQENMNGRLNNGGNLLDRQAYLGLICNRNSAWAGAVAGFRYVGEETGETYVFCCSNPHMGCIKAGAKVFAKCREYSSDHTVIDSIYNNGEIMDGNDYRGKYCSWQVDHGGWIVSFVLSDGRS